MGRHVNGKYYNLPEEAYYKDKNGNRGKVKYTYLTAEDKLGIIHSTREYAIRNPKIVLYSTTKFRAKKKNLPFNLELSDLVIPEFCPVLGLRLEKGTEMSSANSPSIDRIVPELGYTKGNIIIISLKANMIKSNATPEEILQVGEFFLNLLKEQKKAA